MNIGDYYNTHDFWLGIGMPLHDWLVGLGVPAWLVALVYVLIGAVSVLGMITVFVMLSHLGRAAVYRSAAGPPRAEPRRASSVCCRSRGRRAQAAGQRDHHARRRSTEPCTSWRR